MYAYEKQGDNYQLITLDDVNTAVNDWSNRPSYDTVRNVGDYDNGTSGTAVNTTNVMNYDIKNGTNAIQAIEENAAGNVLNTNNVVSLTASTIFVDVEGNVVYTGYTNVPTMTDITFFVVYNRQLNADVVFITDGADNSTSDSFFFVTDDQPLTDIREGTTYYQYDVMMNNDPDATITFQGTNRDSSNRAIAEDTLYKIETITPDGFVKSASRVTGFGLGFDADDDYATYADGYTLRLVRDTDADIAGTGRNNLDNNTGEYIYTYDDETQFVYIQTKLDNSGNVVSKSVNIGTSGMINVNNATDKLAGYNNVYVIAVDDKDARTPKATLIYIVEPVEETETDPGDVSDGVVVSLNNFNNEFTVSSTGTLTRDQAAAEVNKWLAKNGYTTLEGPTWNPAASGSYTWKVRNSSNILTTFTLPATNVKPSQIMYTLNGQPATAAASTALSTLGSANTYLKYRANSDANWTYVAKASASGNITSGMQVYTDYLKVTGATPASLKNLEESLGAYYAPATAKVEKAVASMEGTGIKVGTSKYLPYGCTFADIDTGDGAADGTAAIAGLGQIKFTLVDETGSSTVTPVAYNGTLTVTNATTKGTFMKVDGNFVAAAATLNNAIKDTTVEIGYIQFTAPTLTNVTENNISVQWMQNGVELKANDYILGGSKVTAAVTLPDAGITGKTTGTTLVWSGTGFTASSDVTCTANVTGATSSNFATGTYTFRNGETVKGVLVFEITTNSAATNFAANTRSSVGA